MTKLSTIMFCDTSLPLFRVASALLNSNHRTINSMTTPTIKDDPLYQMLREGHVEQFNQHRQSGTPCDLRRADLRALDLRKLEVKHLDLGDCYLRQADLRGLDLSETNLDGASISGAKISGTLFPSQLSAEEITLSLVHGTRMRYR